MAPLRVHKLMEVILLKGGNKNWSLFCELENLATFLKFGIKYGHHFVIYSIIKKTQVICIKLLLFQMPETRMEEYALCFCFEIS